MIHSRTVHRPAAFALGCICAGLVFRAGLSVRSPVSYDEVFVMGVGLDEALESARAFFIDVPLRRSNAITPLWWWTQAAPALLGGRVSLWGLRLAPLALGAVALAATFFVARARLGRGPAALFVMFAAVSDVLAFCNARGEFAESLLLLWVLPGVCLIGDRKHTVTKGILGWLILMTHLGKGLFLVGALALSDAIAQTMRARRWDAGFRAPWTRGVIGPGISLAMAVGPTIGWLMIAGGLAADGPLETDIGPVAGPGEALWKLTAAYRETKGHMVSTPLDATQIWLDGWVWPVSALTAVPLLVGIINGVRRFHGRRSSVCLGLMPWIGLGFAIIVARGMVGARFHLLYLPAAWLAASIGLWRLRHLAGRQLVVLAGCWIISAWAAFSWTSWADRVWRPSALAFIAAGACALVAGVFTQRRAGVLRRLAGGRAASVSVCAIVLAMVVLACGPLQWAPFARMEPHAGRKELAAVDDYRLGRAPLPRSAGRTLYIDLANYFLTKADRTRHELQRGTYYARLETERVPHSARAWFYLGEALRQSGAPTDSVRSAWERSYELRPLPELRQRLEDLPARPHP